MELSPDLFQLVILGILPGVVAVILSFYSEG